MDDKSNDPILYETNSADDASEHTCNSDGECSGSSDDYPAFSPEGMIKWMFERCNRRYEEAMIPRQSRRLYNVRRVLLVDFMQYLNGATEDQRDSAQEALSSIDDLSSRENSQRLGRASRHSSMEASRGSSSLLFTAVVDVDSASGVWWTIKCSRSRWR